MDISGSEIVFLFELLDSWHDLSNTAAGGYNYYQW